MLLVTRHFQKASGSGAVLLQNLKVCADRSNAAVPAPGMLGNVSQASAHEDSENSQLFTTVQ